MKVQDKKGIILDDTQLLEGGLLTDNISKDQLNGIYSDLCGLIGLENTLVIYSAFKGEQVTFPMRLISKDFSVQRICERYDGTNLKQLASEYGYSERWVREIIKKNEMKGAG